MAFSPGAVAAAEDFGLPASLIPETSVHPLAFLPVPGPPGAAGKFSFCVRRAKQLFLPRAAVLAPLPTSSFLAFFAPELSQRTERISGELKKAGDLPASPEPYCLETDLSLHRAGAPGVPA